MQVAFDLGQGLWVHVYDALLGALAPAADVGIVEVHILQIQRHQLANAESRGIEQFQDGGVAASLVASRAGRHVQKSDNLVLGECFGQRPSHPWGAQRLGRVFGYRAAFGQKPEEGLKSGNLSGGSGVAVSFVASQVADVLVQHFQVHQPPGTAPVYFGFVVVLEELIELAQVVAVGFGGVAGKTFFDNEVLKKRVYRLFHMIESFRYNEFLRY